MNIIGERDGLKLDDTTHWFKAQPGRQIQRIAGSASQRVRTEHLVLRGVRDRHRRII